MALVWVHEKNDAEIREAFQETLDMRRLSPEAAEGAHYAGLKPAGTDVGPAIPAADKAIETGSADHLLRLLSDEAQNGTLKRFEAVMAEKDYRTDDVKAGREYVDAYVTYINYVERVHEAA